MLLSFTEKIHKWKLQLKKQYFRERSEIRFGRRHIDVASIDDLCVGLELYEDEESTSDKHKNQFKGTKVESSLGLFSLSSPFAYQKNHDESQPKGRKLDSYLDLLSLSDHHVLLFGAAGAGKTTQISEIAYAWAKVVADIKSSETESKSQNLSSPELSKLELVLVLDIRKFQTNQTLAEAIKRQLLPGASVDDIDEALEHLSESCLLLLDGYDELSKGIQNHALESPHLTNLFVIVTTRPHLKDQFCRKYGKHTLVKVLGFSKENIPLYIKKFFMIMKKSHLAPSLIQKLKQTPLLQTLSPFPVLLVMICLVWEDAHDRDIPFHSMTSLYKEAVSKYLNKPFEDEGEYVRVHQICHTLGKTGLSELFENNIQIEEGKLENTDVLKEAIEMGLVIQSEGKRVGDRSICFIHKTFQEYCAAIYLSGLLNKDKQMFHLYLHKINNANVDQMEYLLRFCCGLTVEGAAATLTYVEHLIPERHSFFGNVWELPFVLVFEVELSHDINVVDKYHIHSKLLLPILSKIVYIYEANSELLAAITHFACKDESSARETWLREIEVLKITPSVNSIQSMMQVLCNMSSLKHVEVHLEDKLENANVTPNLKVKELKELKFRGPNSTVNIEVLAVLLDCMPVLTKVSLAGIQLTGKLDGNNAVSSQSVKDFVLSGGSANLMQLLNLLSCMHGLTKVSLQACQVTDDGNANMVKVSPSLQALNVSNCHMKLTSTIILINFMHVVKDLSFNNICLTGELEDNPVSDSTVTLNVSMHEVKINKMNVWQQNALAGQSESCYTPVNVATLVSFLYCIPSLENVELENLHLTGEFVDNPMILKESLKEFKISGSSVNVTSLETLQTCIPASTKVSLQLCRLTGEFDPATFIESFRELIKPGDSSMLETSLVSLLSYKPTLSKVSFQQCELIGELGGNPEISVESMKTFSMTGGSMNVTLLISLLHCVPGLTIVSLNQCQLTGEFDSNTVILKESVKELSVSGVSVNVILLLSLLHYMPGLTTVSLKQCQLIDEFDGNPVILQESVKELSVSGGSVNVTLLLSLLHCMPGLTVVSLNQCQLTGEFDGNSVLLREPLKEFKMSDASLKITSLVGLLCCITKSTKVSLSRINLTSLNVTPANDDEVYSEFVVLDLCSGECTVFGHQKTVEFFRTLDTPGNTFASVNVILLLSLLHCMPGLTKVSLNQCQLTGECDGNPVILKESVKELLMLGGIVNVTSLETLQKCMPALTKVSLQQCQLVGDFDPGIFSKIFRELMKPSDNNLLETSLVSLLSYKPTLSKVSFQQCELIGKIVGNPKISVEAMKQFSMSGGSVNVILLLSLLHCMRDLTTVTLNRCRLTGELDGNPLVLSTSLTEFVMFGDSVSIISLVSLLQCMPALTKLSCPSLFGQRINRDGASALAQSFRYTPGLQHLDLGNNSLGTYGISALAQSFQHTPAMQHLILSHNSIDSDGASALAQSFAHIPTLHHLNLRSNSICPDGASALAQSFQHIPALQHLILSHNSIGSNGASALAQPFRHTPTLQHLDLRSNSIGPDGASTLAQSFRHTPTLQHLDLMWNSIGPDGASALAQSFQHTPILQHLDLSRNSISSNGASALAQSFQHTPTLQHLNLSHNSIGPDGASALAQSFRHTPTLQHLNLSNNSVGSDGASALAQSFQHTPALQHLNLSHNSIGSYGASALAQLFQHTPALQHLDLMWNSIGSDGASALAQSFQLIPSLQHLNLFHNSIGPGLYFIKDKNIPK